MKEVWYRQCSYEKENNDGSKTVGIAWLPEKFATVGRPIYFKNPEKIYQVTSVGDKRMEEKVLIERERDWKNQRKASDI